MTLEQQESFAIKGPQLEVLGEAESKLPAPARRRPFANIVLALAILVSVFGIGGARLKAQRSDVLAQFSVTDRYNQGIGNDLSAQMDAAANLIRQASAVLGEADSAVQQAEQALQAANDQAALLHRPDAAYGLNRTMYSAVDALYNAAWPKASGDTADRIEQLYAEFVSRQAVIDRAGAAYNEEARAFNKTAGAFPANLIGMLWGSGEAPLFEASGAQAPAAYQAPAA